MDQSQKLHRKKAGFIRTDLVCGTLFLSSLPVLSLVSALCTLCSVHESTAPWQERTERRIRMTVSGAFLICHSKSLLCLKNMSFADWDRSRLSLRACWSLGAQSTKIWLIHGLWTKPLVHGLPWTCQAVLSQWLQHRNFQTMDLEDPASRSTSSSSSNSASSSESLFAFFDPSSTSALFSSSYSASQSSAAAAVKWVDRSGNKNWDSPMWQLGIFKCSENKQVNHRYWWSPLGSFLSWCCTLLYGTECTERR